MAITLGELAQQVGGKVVGDPSIEITRVSPIESASPGEITFLTHSRYLRFLPDCRASAVIVAPGVAESGRVPHGMAYLEIANPYVAFARILQLFSPAPKYSGSVSPQAFVDGTAQLSEGVTVYPNAYIGARASVGKDSVLYPGAFVGEDVRLGSKSVLYPNVVIYAGCRIGDRVILHAGAVIGGDGFGYAGSGAGRVKIPQIGTVVIEDDVEIGANTTVDRATLGKTTIGRGVKIDNLVQIAHNVTIGEHSVFAAQVGVAGSTRIGNQVTLAGQVGVGNHLEIGDGATIGPKSGVARSVERGAVLSGWVEATPHKQWLKAMMLLPELPRLWRAVRSLEAKLARLLKAAGKEPDGDVGR